MGRVLVVGSSNTDMIMRVPRLPRPGETIIGSDFKAVQGGKGANQAVAAARLGAETTFVACVGNDNFGDQAITGYEKEGIDTSFIKRSANPTGTAMIHIARDGENSIAVSPGANADLTPYDIAPPENLFDATSYLIVQLEVPVSAVTKAIHLAHENGVKTILNPAPAVKLDNFPFHKVYLFTPNETEAEYYTGVTVRSQSGAAKATKILHEAGIENVIISMGKKGAYCSVGDLCGMTEAFSVKATDTTAAGDVFNGALAVALIRYDDIPMAVRFAHGAAALSVTKTGAQPSIPTLEQVLSFTGLN